MRARSLGLVWFGFRVKDKVRVSVRDRVGVRVSDGVGLAHFIFVTLAARRSPHPRRPAFYPHPLGPVRSGVATNNQHPSSRLSLYFRPRFRASCSSCHDPTNLSLSERHVTSSSIVHRTPSARLAV